MCVIKFNENEFYFQADLDKDIVINSFCNAVNENGKIMCRQIEESIYEIENLFK